MKISASKLRQIIKEEVASFKNSQNSQIKESKTIKMTPENLNRIIKEELDLFNKKKLEESTNKTVSLTSEDLNRIIKEELDLFNK